MYMFAGNLDNAAYLSNVCVAQKARRQGIGGALIQAARQHARDWGTTIYLYSNCVCFEGNCLYIELSLLKNPIAV